MGPIKTNWPSGTLPPSSGRKGKRAREDHERERMAAYVAKQDADKLRARFARVCAERDGSPTLTEIKAKDEPDPLAVTRPLATHVPARLGVLPTRKAWRDMQAHVPAHVAAFWAK